jgi:hypothetical protein
MRGLPQSSPHPPGLPVREVRFSTYGIRGLVLETGIVGVSILHQVIYCESDGCVGLARLGGSEGHSPISSCDFAYGYIVVPTSRAVHNDAIHRIAFDISTS